MSDKFDYQKELSAANSIMQKNRHRSCPPFEWFGPDPEPAGVVAGENCDCGGCEARLKFRQALIRASKELSDL